jgi:hypothetical protein
MMRKTGMILLLGLLLSAFPAASHALPGLYNGEGDQYFIDEGRDILGIDYIGIWDNGVYEDGTDYPYASLWLYVYEPENYEDADELYEDDWSRKDEIDRFPLPGMANGGLWLNNDEVSYLNCGIHDWREYDLDRIVFRVVVEEPTADWETDTLIWGTIIEDDTYETLEFHNEHMNIFFRTTGLPEEIGPPSGLVSDIWFEHDVVYDEEEGLEIHAAFDIYGMRTSMCRVCAFVHNDSDDESVMSELDDEIYMTPEGYLTTQTDFIPLYPDTTFGDFILFIPYKAFPMTSRYTEYYVDVEILDEDWNLICNASSPVFEVRRRGGKDK